jgi:hypothetical protein
MNFVMNQPKKYNYISLTQDVKFPEARPIGEALLQLGDSYDQMLIDTADDQDDVTSTLDSLAQVERASGKQMGAPAVDEKLYESQGNKVENLLSDNNRISLRELDEATMEKEDVVKAVSRQQQALSQAKVQQVKKVEQKKTQEQRAFDAVAIHFSDDADSIENEEW